MSLATGFGAAHSWGPRPPWLSPTAIATDSDQARPFQLGPSPMNSPDPPAAPEGTSTLQVPRLRLVEVLALVGLLLFSAWVRIDGASSDEVFSRAPATGLMKSDPGLLLYLTERVAQAESWLPTDWNQDPRIAHPERVDIPRDYTVGQEFLFGWTWKAWGRDVPLWLWCHYGSSILAALTALGVWGLARELLGSRTWTWLACLLYLLLPASYRSLGFVLVREDLSLPLFAAHLWLAARACRTRSSAAIAGAAAMAGLAMGTWHAMSFVVLLEAGALFVHFLLRGRSLSLSQFARVALPLGLTWLFVPSLGFGAMGLILALLGLPAFANRVRPWWPRGYTLLVMLPVVALSISLLNSGFFPHFTHVYEVLLAKLKYGGVPPVDPNELGFHARLLWQGPFATLRLGDAFAKLGLPLLLGLPAIGLALRDSRDWVRVMAIFALLSLLGSWLIVRLTILPALILPLLAVLGFVSLRRHLAERLPQERSPDEPRGAGEILFGLSTFAGVALLIWQGSLFHQWKESLRLSWYRPERHTFEIAEMVEAVKAKVPQDQAVAADFINSTAILAHADRPILLQPKWEREEARQRVEAFWETFYHGTPAELSAWLESQGNCGYLMIDRDVLWVMLASKYCAGIPAHQPEPNPGSAAEALLADLPRDTPEFAPGFRLMWSSSPRVPGQTGALRLFRVE